MPLCHAHLHYPRLSYEKDEPQLDLIFSKQLQYPLLLSSIYFGSLFSNESLLMFYNFWKPLLFLKTLKIHVRCTLVYEVCMLG